MKVTQCLGEGQGGCKRCKELKGWSRTWMCFLYEIEGKEGIYCHECVEAIKKDIMNRSVIE